MAQWFDHHSKTAPGGSNLELRILRQILNYAIDRGHVTTNPTRGIRPNRRPAQTRFLSREEIGRLHRVLDEYAEMGHRQQADIVRLLLLTGCRKSEIIKLRWAEFDGDTLALADTKTGPRRVYLSACARRIVESQPSSDSPFVFPSPFDPARPRSRDLALWYRVRRNAGIEDCRLHDLRHTHASQAAMNGVPLPIISRLLGHSNARMTMRYAHLGDREIQSAAERIGEAMALTMGLPLPGSVAHLKHPHELREVVIRAEHEPKVTYRANPKKVI